MNVQNRTHFEILRQLISFSLVFSILGLTMASAQAQTFATGTQQTTLIELYTSQGCSSCPPAERYLNSFKNHPQIWTTYIPVALHVDYWDYLGWKDRFASPVHTQRQRNYARVNLQNTIYTPGFFVNGEPWRRGFFNSAPKPSKEEVGILSLILNEKKVTAVFSGTGNSANQPLTLTVAVLGMGYKIQIGAGENEGRTSEHEFVNLNYVSKDASNGKWEMSLPKFSRNGASQFALVAWVSKKGDPRPVQSVGGYIEN